MRKQEKKKDILNILKNHIDNNLKQYMLVSIMFFLGIIISVIVINNIDKNSKQYEEVSITTTIDSLKKGYEIDNIELLKKITLNHIIFTTLMWFLGCSLIGIPIVYLLVVYKGFSLGYTISYIILAIGTGKGIWFSIITLLLQNIIIVPATLSLAVSSINLYKSIIKNKKIENVKLEIIRHTVISLFILIALFVAGIVEVYISNFILKLCINYF